MFPQTWNAEEIFRIFVHRHPDDDTTNFPDCPLDPGTGLRFSGDTVTIDPVAAALLPMIPVANGLNSGFAAYQGLSYDSHYLARRG